jgi:hypothetical protein
MSRQDLLVALSRFASFMGAKLPAMRDWRSFKDGALAAGSAKDAIEIFYEAGLVSGKGDGIFDPEGTAARAELAAMLRRFIETAL